MKKVLLVLAVALMAFTVGAQAQENNHKWVLGGTGNFSFDRDKIENKVLDEATSFHIEPFVGYQLSERWRVGFTVCYKYQRNKIADETGNLVDYGARHLYRMGPYVHYDIFKYNRWILFAEAEGFYIWSPKAQPMDVEYLSGDFHEADAPFDVKLQAFRFTVKPGLTYVLSDHVNLDFNFNFLGWYYENSKLERLDNGVVMTRNHNGLVLDMLEATLNDYWENVAVGITFKL